MGGVVGGVVGGGVGGFGGSGSFGVLATPDPPVIPVVPGSYITGGGGTTAAVLPLLCAGVAMLYESITLVLPAFTCTV